MNLKMKVTIQTRLACAAARAFEEVQRPLLLSYVAAPLLKFAPLNSDRLPDTWKEGDFFVTMSCFGFLPLGTERIGISIKTRADGVFCLRDDGGGTLVRSWDHLITIHPQSSGACIYRDTVEINTGVLTPLVWIFAQLFYRWRQHRWRRLVAGNFQYR